MLDIPIFEYTETDVNDLCLNVIIGQTEDIDNMSSVFESVIDSPTQKHDAKSLALLTLLAIISTFALRRGDEIDIFQPRLIFSNGTRTPIVDDLQDGHFDMLQNILPFITNNDLKARVADVLWQRKRRNVANARIAVAAYFESAQEREDSERWDRPILRLARALEIALKIAGGYREDLETIERWLIDKLRSFNDTSSGFYCAEIMNLLLKTQRSMAEAEEFAVLGAAIATKSSDAHQAQVYYGLSSKWYQRAGNVDLAKSASIEAARTYGLNARSQPNAIGRAALLSQGVQALRDAGGDPAEIQSLRDELDTAQRESVTEFTSVESSIDITASVRKARERARGLSFQDAMVALARALKPPDKATLRTRAIELSEKTPFRSMIGSKNVDFTGRVIGVRPGLLSQDPTEKEDAIIAEMCDNANMFRSLAVNSVIEPFRQEMLYEHRPSLQDVVILLSDRPFIQRSRVEFYARAIYAGIYGRFLEAAHILVPQIEHSIRCMVQTTGAIVYSQDASGVQDFYRLNRLLEEPKLQTILSEDYVFELQGLLIERFGNNFRNNLSHGLLSPDETRGYASIYIWWLSLHFALNLSVSS